MAGARSDGVWPAATGSLRVREVCGAGDLADGRLNEATLSHEWILSGSSFRSSDLPPNQSRAAKVDTADCPLVSEDEPSDEDVADREPPSAEDTQNDDAL